MNTGSYTNLWGKIIAKGEKVPTLLLALKFIKKLALYLVEEVFNNALLAPFITTDKICALV